MTKLNKVEGAKELCPTCHQEMTCVSKPGYNGKPATLQWQTNGQAHYGWNAAEGKAFCKASQQAGAVAGKRVTEGIQVQKIILPLDQIADITAEATDIANRLILVLNAVQTQCNAVGIEHPATIGMLFYETCETRRQNRIVE